MDNDMEDFISAPGSLIKGAGGGKGGGGASAPVEAENTLRSSAVVRIVEVVSEGPIEGLAGGAAGIYINDTPLANANGTFNFVRAEWDYRVGLPNQDYMPGFNAVEAAIEVNTPVSIASNNIIHAVSATNIDAVEVTIQLPNGLSLQDTATGNLNGTDVTFTLQTALGAGPYSTVGTYTISGKTTSPYEASYRISRPVGTGLWSVRVVRVTADPASTAMRNETTFARATEIQEVQVSYPDAAIVGVAIDAQSVSNNSIPTRSYLVKGVLVQVPSNLNTATRTYTGAWNGLLQNTTSAYDNPVWALYDVLTNQRYGAGLVASTIDVYSFYDASVYCDQAITFTDEAGAASSEPRYTFNAVISDRPDIQKLVASICGSMAANLIYWNGKWTLIQDRPTSVSKLLTKANVIDGLFTYKSSGLYERHTAVNVSYNDRGDRYLERIVTVEDTTGLNRYGYLSTDLVAFGATTEGQAIRAGRWALDTEQHQSDICEFKASLNGFDMCPGDVINVYDEDYANTVGAGKVASYTPGSTTVVLDRAVVVTSGSTITALLADGRTLETHSIIGTGTLSTLSLSSAFSTALLTQADYIITSAISPRPFKVINVTLSEPNVVDVQCAFYDPNKFARVETGVSLPSATFTNQLRTVIPPPTGLTLAATGKVLPNGLPRRFLTASWTAPSAAIAGYNVAYTFNSGQRQVIEVAATVADIPADEDGIYSVSVFSKDFNGNVSGQSANASFTMTSNVLTVDPSGFGPPVNFVAIDSNGTTWTQDDLVVRWAANPTNLRSAVEWKLEVYTGASVLLRTVTIPGTTLQYNYDIATNRNDGSGVPRATLIMKVYGKDAMGAYSNPDTVTFTNPPPAAVTNFTATGMYKGALLRWDQNTEADLQGYYVWRGSSAGFTPSTTNLVYSGFATTYLDGVLTDTTTYYWKIAAYDKFTNSKTGAGLNVTSATAASTGTPGIKSYGTLPTTGNAVGDVAVWTVDGLLYKWDGTHWRVVGMFLGTSVQMNAKTGMFTGDMWSNTDDNKLYRYTGSIWTAAVAAVDMTGNLTSDQIASLSVAKLTGKIGSYSTLFSGQIVAGDISAGAVTTGSMNVATISGDRIAANTLDASRIIAGTVDTNHLNVSDVKAGIVTAASVQSAIINTGIITAGSGIIADLAVTTLKVAGNAITIPLGVAPGPGPWVQTNVDQDLLTLNFFSDVACNVAVTMSGSFRGSFVSGTADATGGAVPDQSSAFTLLLIRNGVELARWNDIGGNGVLQNFSATFMDTNLPAGSYFYIWHSYCPYPTLSYGWSPYGNTQAGIMTPCMVAMVVKR